MLQYSNSSIWEQKDNKIIQYMYTDYSKKNDPKGI